MMKAAPALHPESSMHLEDKALKVAAQYFGSELLPLWGIKGNVVRIAPTEQVHLEARDFMEDFNYELDDGSWAHLEFESDSIRKKDLKRFRIYESYISFSYDVPVTTYVICSSNVRKVKSKLEEGLNTYRVKIIRMKDSNGDEIICNFEEKQRTGKSLERGEMVSLILSPLMSGTFSQKERIKRGIQILQNECNTMAKEDIQRMQSVLYAFAAKFLNRVELSEIKEVLTMTILGQMLMEDGIQRGIILGRTEGKAEGAILNLISLTRKKAAKGFTAGEIADFLEEDADHIHTIFMEIEKHPTSTDEEILYFLKPYILNGSSF